MNEDKKGPEGVPPHEVYIDYSSKNDEECWLSGTVQVDRAAS